MGRRHESELLTAMQTAGRGSYVITATEPYDKATIDSPARHYHLRKRKDGRSVAGAVIEGLPGCCGVLLLRGLHGQAKEVAKFIDMVAVAAQKMKYGSVLLTLRAESPIIGLLTGAQRITFLNGKTNNRVSIIALELKQIPAKIRVPVTDAE